MEIFANSRFQEVVIHDLRTPLNVICLALRMLDGANPADSAEVAEDLAMIRVNTSELERMLVYLVDVSRLPGDASGLTPERFNPHLMIEEIGSDHRAKPGAPLLEIDFRDGPEVVYLDYSRARMAIQKSLANAAAASGGKPIALRVGGGPERCRISFELAVPPRDSVQSHEIEPEAFQRILGTPAERRGLDLSIAARISTLFGGRAHLQAVPGEGTAVILDWPARLASAQ